jgi:hypothetical protein
MLTLPLNSSWALDAQKKWHSADFAQPTDEQIIVTLQSNI